MDELIYEIEVLNRGLPKKYLVTDIKKFVHSWLTVFLSEEFEKGKVLTFSGVIKDGGTNITLFIDESTISEEDKDE